MDIRQRSRTLLRPLTLGSALLFVAAACTVLPPGMLAVDPVVTPSPEPPTVCQSATTLEAAIEDLREVELEDAGVLGVLLTVDIAIDETRQFAAVVGDEYREPVSDLLLSLQGLRTTIDELGEQTTLGASVVTVGESIVEIGTAMDVLAVQLRTPCPSEVPA